MKRNLFFLCILAAALAMTACEKGTTPGEYAFSETREIEGVMIEASDKAFHSKEVTPGLSPALQVNDTTYYIYQHFDEYEPFSICGQEVYCGDTLRVLARIAKALDYNKSTYFCIDISKVLECK